MGRRSGYDPAFAEVAERMAKAGATDREIATAIGCAPSTFYLWRHKYPEFSESLKIGKVTADERVVSALFHRAVGYTFDAVKVFQHRGEPVVVPYVEHIPPDVTAAIFWLKNRQPAEWQEKCTAELHTNIDIAGELERARKYAFVYGNQPSPPVSTEETSDG